MANRRVHPARQVRRTALLVGEGLAEEVFLKHLKAIYVERGVKTVTVKNAKGKGGKQVLDYTIAQRKVADYDQQAALLDTDTDWDDEQRAHARRHRVTVFEADPCLEAMLLRIAGYQPPGTTGECKQAFQRRFGAAAHDERVYEQYFGRQVLDAARARVPVLQQLIEYLSD